MAEQKVPRSYYVKCYTVIFIVLLVLLLGAIYPQLYRVRGGHPATYCAMNLKNISTAMSTYATSNNNAFPDTLFRLIEDKSMNIRQLVCPVGELTGHEAMAEPVTRERFDFLMGKSGYVYVWPNDGSNADPEAIIMYEKPRPHWEGKYVGMNILLGDGSVRYYKEKEGLAVLKKQGIVVEPYKKKGWW